MRNVSISSYHRSYSNFSLYFFLFGTITLSWYDSDQRLYKVDDADSGSLVKAGFTSFETAEEWCNQMEYTIESDPEETV
ncbi:hypothetical protein LEP1GSC126_0085 [Leptospira kirschneri str. 200801774]|nr:hypothetical protein LEP1GSC126_0085 [Leptospira kirschneri str. 200801774]